MFLSEMDNKSSKKRQNYARQTRYSQHDLQKAVDAVLNGNTNPTRAARVFGVPRQTIISRMSNLVWQKTVILKLN